MKREKRRAVLVGSSIYLLCVFRGEFIEHVFFGRSEDEVLSELKESGVEGEVKGLNEDPELIEVCRNVLSLVEEKLKRNGVLTSNH